MASTLLKEKLLRNCKLYLILDTDVADYDRLFDVAHAAVQGGADILQLRDKKGPARDLMRFADRMIKITKHKVPFIINDRVDVAAIAECDGVHLGQDDLPVGKARSLVGRGRIIGASCQTWAHCLKAQRDGADYIGFGSVFTTKTKPDRLPMDLKVLQKTLRCATVPVFPIGGIDRGNVGILKRLGVIRLAVCRAICEADEPLEAARFLKTAIC
jgi:thiamine-phosphate pyrophosphorylase